MNLFASFWGRRKLVQGWVGTTRNVNFRRFGVVKDGGDVEIKHKDTKASCQKNRWTRREEYVKTRVFRNESLIVPTLCR